MGFRFGVVPDLHVLESEIEFHENWLAENVVDRFRKLHAVEPLDAVLVTGDLAGHKVPHIARPVERCVVSEALAELADMAPVIVCRGNHDLLNDWDHLNLIPNVYFIDEPELLRLPGGCAVMVLPWLDASQVEGKGGWDERVRSAYMAAIEDAAKELQDVASSDDAARVLLCHGVVHGARLNQGQPKLPYSVPSLPLELYDDPSLFDAAVFGHVHYPHAVGSSQVLTLHAGSCFTSRHGEDRDKGPFMVVVESPGPSGNTRFMNYPSEVVPRLMWRLTVKKHAVTFEDIGASPLWPGEQSWPSRAPANALVKLRVEASREHEPVVAEAISKLRIEADNLDIANLNVEYRWTQAVRARQGAAAVAKATTPQDRARHFWSTQSNGPSPKTQRDALRLIKDLEKDAQSAV